jgi:hypothetical protein
MKTGTHTQVPVPMTIALSQITKPVATTPTIIRLISWNQQFFIVPLHQLFESYVCSFCIFVLGYWLFGLLLVMN